MLGGSGRGNEGVRVRKRKSIVCSDKRETLYLLFYEQGVHSSAWCEKDPCRIEQPLVSFWAWWVGRYVVCVGVCVLVRCIGICGE